MIAFAWLNCFRLLIFKLFCFETMSINGIMSLTLLSAILITSCESISMCALFFMLFGLFTQPFGCGSQFKPGLATGFNFQML